MKTVSYLTLIAAICVVVMTPQSANAQCMYRMNDVGRPHGYVSGPCRGSELNLAGAYPTHTAVKKEPRPRAKKVFAKSWRRQ
jgi:hypothetical protein